MNGENDDTHPRSIDRIYDDTHTQKKKTLEPIDSSMNIRSGNQITFLINKKNEDKAQQWLKDNKFEKTVKTK